MRIPHWTFLPLLNFLFCAGLYAQETSTLLSAVKVGNEHRVDSLLSVDASFIEWRGQDHETLLHWAVEANDTLMASLLIERNADFNAADHYGWTPLHFAAGQGKTAMVKLLLKKAALSDPKSKTKWTPLHWAITGGHADIVKLLLAQGADAKTRSTSTLLKLNVGAKSLHGRGWGGTPLHEAARANHVDVAKLLIDAGAEIHDKDQYGRSPLHVAADRGSLEMAKHLIGLGADVTERSDEDYTPLMEAADLGYTEVMSLLIQNGADVNETVEPFGQNLLQYYIPNDTDKSVTQCLIENGANVNYRDKDGVTPLHIAAWWGRVADVALLLSAGADVNAADHAGGSALHWAAWNGRFDLIGILVDQGLKTKVGKLCELIMLGDSPGAKAWLEKNPAAAKGECTIPLLHWAVLFSGSELIEPLVSGGADVNASVKWEDTPFAYARYGPDRPEPDVQEEYGGIGTVYEHETDFPGELFGGETEVEDPKPLVGETALSLAVNRDRKEIVEALLENGARADLRTYGISTLGWAAARGYLELAELMLKAGAAVNELDELGYASIHRAVISGQLQLVQLLLKHQADPNLPTHFGQTALDLCGYPKNQKLENMILQRGGKYSKDLPQNKPDWPDY